VLVWYNTNNLQQRQASKKKPFNRPRTAAVRSICYYQLLITLLLFKSNYNYKLTFICSDLPLPRLGCKALQSSCQAVCSLTSQKAHVHISLVFLCITCGHGPVLLWWQLRRCVLPVLRMTSCCHIRAKSDQNQRWRVCFIQFTRWWHQGKVCHPPTTSC